MYKVEKSEKVYNIIFGFILSYKNKFLDLYSDTWIYYEDIIVKNYVDSSEKFKDEILENIDKELEWTIIWYKVLENWNFKITIMLRSFNLFVEYSENKTEKIRYVEDIEFHKK